MKLKKKSRLSTTYGSDIITSSEVKHATETLQKYKAGKQNLEQRIVENEKWWKMQHWDFIRSKQSSEPEPASGWLFNSIANKHADAMDNYPEPTVLPRERGDSAQAKILSAILPALLERNDFEKTYSDVWWYKLKTTEFSGTTHLKTAEEI